ncbi:MAG TPA: VOC family protein [Candidatus Sulfotelmatobacter sp.]|nr:VOC family protein [Candidatus Sulfotelmatobacter sp.]
MLRAATLLCISLLFTTFVSAQTPQRPKIYGIAYVRIKSSDFQKASETYSKILGLSPSGDSCTGVKSPCFAVNHHQHIELTHADPGAPGSWLDEVAFRTNDVGAMRDYLKSQGISVSDIQTAGNSSPFIEAQDPENNRIAFVQVEKAPNPPPPSPTQVSFRIFHAGFVVRNLPTMRHFYMDQLGFRLYWKGGFKDLPPGTPETDSDIDWFEIQVPNGDDWVEFMLNIAPNADHQELGVQNHFCLGVPNMQKALDQLHKNGLAPDSKFADDKSEIGRDGKWQFDIFDPDWTRIEFMEPAPAQNPCCNPYTAPQPKL